MGQRREIQNPESLLVQLSTTDKRMEGRLGAWDSFQAEHRNLLITVSLHYPVWQSERDALAISNSGSQNSVHVLLVADSHA